jgi:uncharacterized protein YaeQ
MGSFESSADCPGRAARGRYATPRIGWQPACGTVRAILDHSLNPWPADMALKSTIYKAQIQIADMDRGVYADHALTLALHPSETEERLMVRLLAFALHVPKDDARGELVFARGLSDGDEPDLWQHDLSGQLVHWIEVGQPDERRMQRAAARAEQASFIAYAASTPVWWAGVKNKLTRATRLRVWQLPAAQSQALAALAQRSMQLQFTVQDATVWCHAGDENVELALLPLQGA